MKKGQDQTESVLHHHGPEEWQFVHLIDGPVLFQVFDNDESHANYETEEGPHLRHCNIDPLAGARFRAQLFVLECVAYLFVS